MVAERVASQILGALTPVVMEDIVEVVRTISHERIRQRIDEEIAHAAVPSIQEPATQHAVSCSSQSSEWVERQKSRGEELLAIRETIKLMRDDDDEDAPELSKATLPIHSNQKLTALALRSKSVEVFNDR